MIWDRTILSEALHLQTEEDIILNIHVCLPIMGVQRAIYKQIGLCSALNCSLTWATQVPIKFTKQIEIYSIGNIPNSYFRAGHAYGNGTSGIL